GTGTKLGGFEHARLHPRLGKLYGTGEPRIARADDDHARGARHVDEVTGGWAVGFPPVGMRLEVPVQDVAVCHRLPPRRSVQITASSARLWGGAADFPGSAAPRRARFAWQKRLPPWARPRSRCCRTFSSATSCWLRQ